MKLSKTTTGFAVLAGLILFPVGAGADSHQSKGYAYSQEGKIVRAPTGDCVRTLLWSFANAVAECDPDAVLKGLAEAPTEKAAANVELVMRFRTVTETLQGGQAFAFDDDKLSRSAMRKLDRISALHKRVLLKQITVFGHTDRLGDEEYNKDLSRRRAEAAKLYMMKHDVPEDVISVIAVGSGDAVARCEGMDGDRLKYCLAPNRRTEIRYTVPHIEGGLLADLAEKRSTETVTGVKMTRQYFSVSNELNRLWRNLGNSCRTEIKDLCVVIKPGDGKLGACLYQNYGALSAGCKADLDAAQHYIRGTVHKVKQLANACATDMAVTCNDTKLGSGAMLGCLVARAAKVDQACRDMLISYDMVN